MKGKTCKDFITALYSNPEIEFAFRSDRYLLSGCINSSNTIYRLELWNITKNLFVFRHEDGKRENCVEQFEQAKIFEGMTIYEAESEIKVFYG